MVHGRYYNSFFYFVLFLLFSEDFPFPLIYCVCVLATSIIFSFKEMLFQVLTKNFNETNSKSSIHKVILSQFDQFSQLIYHYHCQLLLFITIVIFMIAFTIFVIYKRVQWQVLGALLTLFGPGTSLLF